MQRRSMVGLDPAEVAGGLFRAAGDQQERGRLFFIQLIDNEVAHIDAERRHGFVKVHEIAEVLARATWCRRTLPSE